MDAARIRGLKPLLNCYLANFDDCFGRADTRCHLPVYVQGQLSDLPRKSVEPLALAANMPPRTLQQFLSLSDWDHGRLVDRLQELVARDHASSHAVGIVDETACPKKGAKTPCVQRQYCGATGKIENCVVTVHLGYAVDDLHCLLDNDPYLPESWANDRERCREAGIPDDVVYRPKWRIALDLFDRAVANGVCFRWLTFDEGYGSKPEFMRELDRRGQRYVAEVPVTFMGWIKLPRLVQGQRRLRVNRKPSSVGDLLRYSPALRDQPWQRFRVKEGQKGPMIWEAKHVRFHVPRADGDPSRPMHLLVARNVLKPDERKYFVSNAGPKTKLETLLLVAFSRWHIERCFEDEKTELGFDHYEGRNYTGLIRHQALTAVSHLFLERTREQWRGEKPGPDRLPTADSGRSVGPIVVARANDGDATVGTHRRQDHVPAATERQGQGEPYQTHPQKTSRIRHTTDRLAMLPMG